MQYLPVQYTPVHSSLYAAISDFFISSEFNIDSEGFWRWCITLRITGLVLSKGPNWVGVFPLHLKAETIQFLKRRVC
jgi:hypothetical protein